jgi:hypothetical protein
MEGLKRCSPIRVSPQSAPPSPVFEGMADVAGFQPPSYLSSTRKAASGSSEKD